MTVECVQQHHSAPEDSFQRYWHEQGEWVEAPNQRRGGQSGVQRVYDAEGRML